MSDPVSTDTVETPAPVETPVVETDKDKLEIPEHLKPYIKSLRDEAAGHRTGKAKAVEDAVNAVKATHAQELADRDVAYTALETELGKAWIELEKYQTAIGAKVPSDKVQAFVNILKGDDKESISASAKDALALSGTTKMPAYDPSRGTGGGDPLPLNGDKLMAALVAAVNKG